MQIIIGRKPVLEALNSDEKLDHVYILYGQKGGIIDAIIVAAKKRGVKCSQVTAEKFKHITKNPNAQGVAASRPAIHFYTLKEILEEAKHQTYPLIVILDSIQDTHNVGALLRTSECSGAAGVFITRHGSAPINETVIKTSAGAAEHIKICPVNNLAQTIEILKKEKFWIIGASVQKAKPYTEIDYKIPVALILGNEEKGIRRLTAQHCDQLVYIPMAGKIQSLNVSVAAGIILFEIQRQRKISG